MASAAKIIKDARLNFGSLPVPLLESSPLSPMARLLWGVLSSYGETSFPGLGTICHRMGLSQSSHKTVIRYLLELADAGFVRVASRIGDSNTYELTMPDYCFIQNPVLAGMALDCVPCHESGAYRARGPAIGKRGATARVARLAAVKARLTKAAKAQTDQSGGGMGQPAQGVWAGQPMGYGSASPSKQEPKQEPKQGGSQAAPPSATRTKPPASFEAWPVLFENTTGKPWTWTATEIKAAFEIDAAIGCAETTAKTLKRYTLDAYWERRGFPLSKLLQNLNEFRAPSKPKAPPVKASKPAKAEAPQEPAPDGWAEEYERRQQEAARLRAEGASEAKITRMLYAPYK